MATRAFSKDLRYCDASRVEGHDGISNQSQSPEWDITESQVAARRASGHPIDGRDTKFCVILDHLDKTPRVSRQITTSVPDCVRPRAERP